ncbi:DUF2381 family protein [Myxococcus llanfairpwllgwyngyllgogerychwyrndrobwllllantysiliogogogochensis]|uniref:DUF2381 family protein n=1 Tax=Myxococcus llanfairpwllgwyngyllgogerychwyrndrobwllllantysiliogogogochensis TaxID=2590453 RepID=A0A540WL73_9BACT|nr:DUF2381 family protein [Myxococcus llanfairpwllgwyngyllgogerychwyrndrobwllllantysiliogogogochensis]TQF09184.1 DUF2381 family protein [Myxococcus llanfairpwllgwyngyllgogerychwyrndrobwllllantysiliogogogochensis]
MGSSGFARVGTGESALLRPVAILSLLVGVAASAQPLPAPRERQERRVALSSGPAEPVPELRVAAGITTLLLFDAPLDRGSVELEGRERFRLVDVGERILALEPAVDLGPGERLGLRVRFAGSVTQDRGVFVLVSHTAQVDTRVEVFRRKDSVELLHAELMNTRAQLNAQAQELQTLRALRDSGGPVELIMSGALDDRVRVSRSKGAMKTGPEETLEIDGATGFRAPEWAAISVKVRNTGKKSWAPTLARVVNSKSGQNLGVIRVRSALPRVEPEGAGLVVIETEVPPWPLGEVCRVDLLDNDGVVQVVVPRIEF